MAKLKPSSVGMSLGITLAVIYTIRTIALLLFPNFAVNVGNKIIYKMILINLPAITADSYVIGIIVLLIAGFICGTIFAWAYNWASG